jgi:hypothetical protein
MARQSPITYSRVGMILRTLLLSATLCSATFLAGCGGGGGSGNGGGGKDVADNAAYSAAYDICVGGVESTASDYAVAPTKDAVSATIVEQVSGGRPEDEAAARQGCLDALNGVPRKDEQ